MKREQSNEYKAFEDALRTVVSVSHDEIKRREDEYKRERTQQKKKRTKTSPASHVSRDKD